MAAYLVEVVAVAVLDLVEKLSTCLILRWLLTPSKFNDISNSRSGSIELDCKLSIRHAFFMKLSY